MAIKQKLYLMRNELGRYKIGISQDPKSRRRQLENQGGIYVALVHQLDVFDAELVEKELHEIYKEFRVMGEWFDLSDCIAEDFERIVKTKTSEGEIYSKYKEKELSAVINLAYLTDKHCTGAKYPERLTDRENRWRLAIKSVIVGRDRSGKMFVTKEDFSKIDKRFDKYYRLGYSFLKRRAIELGSIY